MWNGLLIFINAEICYFQKLIDVKEVITPTHKLIATKLILFITDPRPTKNLAHNMTYEGGRTREVVQQKKNCNNIDTSEMKWVLHDELCKIVLSWMQLGSVQLICF